MSPSELAKCRENLKRRWENRQVDKELLQRAWETAHSLATVLYRDFGATKVAVFGSLTEPERFTQNSDIDIVVWGVSYNKCLDALWETKGLNPEFKIDIINFKSVNSLFRERVLSQAVPIDKAGKDVLTLMNASGTENGETYTVNRDELIQRIADERTKIDRTIGSIMELLQEIEVATPHHRKFFEELTAKKLAEVYSGIERIFERIANEIDKHLPKGERWHTDLLTQMAERRPERPPVISEGTQQRLRQFLRFRHKVNNIYGDELIYEEAEKHAKQVSKLFESVTEELDAFNAFLNGT
jgi:predicted nucleotidyltransferase